MEIGKLRDNILRYQLIILVGILMALIGFLTYHLVWLNQNQMAGSEKRAGSEKLGERRLDGRAVAAGAENLYPVAVIVDNHFEAWPTFGLSQAGVVYEALVEGKFTRFLAIYAPDEGVEKIGPIRSARPYFLPIAKEYEALLAHSGGSPEALAQIEEMGIYNLEEIAWWGPDYFWRVYSRSSPHNLFSSSKNLAQGVADWELADKTPRYRKWKFEEKIDRAEHDEATRAAIDFSIGPEYDVSYEYVSSTESYRRFQDGEAYIDGLGNNPIEVQNVVVQLVPPAEIIDEVGRIKLKVAGSGQAHILRDGIKIEGSWRKVTDESRTVYYDQSGQEVEFKPGSIWIAIVPEDRQVTIE